MDKIITSKQELDNKLSEIRAAAHKAQNERCFYYDTFFILASLVPSLPPLIHGSYGYDTPDIRHEDPLFKGADTVVVSSIECMADYSQSDTLTFERRHRDIRCFPADGLYLHYPYVYQSKTRSLASLAYGSIILKWGRSIRPSLSKPNNIGVLTQRKLQAWVNYTKALAAKCEEAENESNAHIAQSRDRLHAVCPDQANLGKGSIKNS